MARHNKGKKPAAKKRKSNHTTRNAGKPWLILLTAILILVAGLWALYAWQNAGRQSAVQQLPQALQKGVQQLEQQAAQLKEKPQSTPSPKPPMAVKKWQNEGLTTLLPGHDPATPLVHHQYFSLYYNETHEQPEWVAYVLKNKHLTESKEARSSFRTDPLVVTGSAHYAHDYKGNGFDCGHLAPAADFAWNPVAMNECFYMSNMSPQKAGFNRGVWKKLENFVRQRAVIDSTLLIVTGPVLQSDLATIGQNEVSVPTLFYKVMYDIHGAELKAVAFLLKNEKSKQALSTFVVPIDSVEALIQHDFLPALPDSIEQALEKHNNKHLWFN